MTKGHGKENQHKDAKPSHDKPAYDKVTHDKDAGPREEQKPRPISPVEMFALHYFKALEGSDDEPETDLSKFYRANSTLGIAGVAKRFEGAKDIVETLRENFDLFSSTLTTVSGQPSTVMSGYASYQLVQLMGDATVRFTVSLVLVPDNSELKFYIATQTMCIVNAAPPQPSSADNSDEAAFTLAAPVSRIQGQYGTYYP